MGILIILFVGSFAGKTYDQEIGSNCNFDSQYITNQAVFQPQQMPGWPKTVGVHPNFRPSGTALADIDNDGNLDIITGSTDGSFHIWDYEGSELTGWPKTGLGAIQTEAAIGDIDDDGDYEIVVPDRTGNLYVWHHDGANVSGWPQSVGETGGLKAAVLFDLDNDGDLEIILGQRLYPNGRILVFHHDGTPYSGWPQSLDYMCVATPAIGDVDLDGQLEICAVSYYSVHLWDEDGNIETGWPLLNIYGGASYAQPVLSDLDDDGDLEILCAYYTSNQDYVSIYHHDGSTFTGWPQTYPGPQGYISPVNGDIDDDFDLEIFGGGHVIGSYDFSSRHHSGQEVTGWPVVVGNVECSPIVSDIDGDGLQEVLLGNNSTPGQFFAFNGDGSNVSGFPIGMNGAAMVNSAAIGDVDDDGDLEISMVNNDGTVNLWTLDGHQFFGYLTDWGSYYHDLWNTGWFHPLPPENPQANGGANWVELSWDANPEEDLWGYNVYRSQNSGGPYQRLNSNLIQTTTYIDTGLAPGTYYYCITAYIRGCAESRLSDEVNAVVEIAEERSKKQRVKLLLPNPSRSGINLPFRCDVEIFNVDGRSVKKVHNTDHIDLEVPPGLYFLKLGANYYKLVRF